MIDHEIDEHANATLLGAMSEFYEVTHRSISWIDAIVVGDVVTIVAMRGDLKRHQPDGRHSEPMQIIQSPQQAGEVADAVAVGIHECPNRQTVDNGVLIPEVVDHRVGEPD